MSFAHSTEIGWKFDNSYARLPKEFFVRVEPSPVRAPALAIVNYRLARELGLNLEQIPEQDVASLFSGNRLPEEAEPIAQAYAGHQFGGFTMLGDGRAILLGEQITPSGLRFDVQLKGSGPTPFSRRGDGRAALGPMLREYIISEALAHLEIPTTRSLAVVKTGEPVYRESILQGAVLTRIAASHIRVGTFEYLAARNDLPKLRLLADYTIQRHYPNLLDRDKKYEMFFEEVMRRQADLVAQWQTIGFVHGVMNTDNVAVSGESIDFGPCAFMNTYDPATVFSSIDSQGRYAYGNQPTICHWNLVRFAEALLGLFHADETASVEVANSLITKFPDIFREAWIHRMRPKFGLKHAQKDDEQLAIDFLDWMYEQQLDFINSFRSLANLNFDSSVAFSHPSFLAWKERWLQRIVAEGSTIESASDLMKRHNPSVIPRNHVVEEALSAAESGDLQTLHDLLEVLSDPYGDLPSDSRYLQPPPSNACGYKTFCGT